MSKYIPGNQKPLTLNNRIYIENKLSKPHRMMLIQGDIKYDPKLSIWKNCAKIQTYEWHPWLTAPVNL